MYQSHILVLTGKDDPHADHVIHRLHGRGARVSRIDPADIPTMAVLSVDISDQGGTQRSLMRGRDRISLGAVDSVWFRRPGMPTPDASITDESLRSYVQTEVDVLASSTWDDLDALALPGTRSDIRQASQKTTQLARAQKIGFHVPPTLITTDPEEFLDFWDHHEGQVITKPLYMPVITYQADPLFRMADMASTQDLTFVNSLSLCPLIVQAYVPKLVELRVTVVGSHVFAAEIRSQASNHSRTDWRNFDSSTNVFATHALPEDISEKCRTLVVGFGLRYGAIDLILTPAGDYVFLEVNPSGQWLWIEDATGLPISEAIVDLLIDGPNEESTSTPEERAT